MSVIEHLNQITKSTKLLSELDNWFINMILSDKFIEEVSILDNLDINQYEKIVNFAISYIVKHDT